MAIEIIDGFKVSSAVPVDNRIVASGSNARSAIAYKYEGLRVFDTYDSTPYVWLSNSWKKENQTALSAATVTLGFDSNTNYRVGQILKVFDSANTLTNSNIFEKLTLNAQGGVTNRTIAINHIDVNGNTPDTVSSTAKLDVNGTIKADSFEGMGSNIIDISPLNFNTSTNKIEINQIKPGPNGYFLGNVSGQLAWLDLTAGFSPTSLDATIEKENPNVESLIFINTSGNSGNVHRHFSSDNYLIGVIPATGQIVVKNSIAGGGVTSPPYSFISNLNTGIYNSAVNSVGISSNGVKKVEIDTNGIKIAPGSVNNPGISFINANNYGIYQTTPRIGIVVAGNEMIRIKSSSTQGQGNGNTAIYGDGGLLSLIGNTHAYMEFYRTGSANPNANGVDTPSGSGRGAYIGYPSGSTNFEIKNTSTSTYISLLSTGVININSKLNGNYGIEIGNSGSGTVTNAYGVYMYGTFTTTQLQNSHSAIIARFDAKDGVSTSYTSVYVTTQGLVIWGCPTGTGAQPTYSGSAARPSIAFNTNPTTGLYSDAANTLGITTGGTKKIVINSTGVQMAAFESENLLIPTIANVLASVNGNNNTSGSSNYAFINAVNKTLISNSGGYTAKWIRLGFKFKTYTRQINVSTLQSNCSSQSATFAEAPCDRMFYCSVSAGEDNQDHSLPNDPNQLLPSLPFRGFQAKFYIGGMGNGNYLGRFLSVTGAAEQIFNGASSFYVPAGHTFTIVFEWYAGTSTLTDLAGLYAMEVRAFKMGLS